MAGRYAIRKKTQHKNTRARTPSAYQLGFWGDTPGRVNQAWIKLIMGWWRDNNVPNGKAWWTALAATVTVDTYPGQLKILSAPRFFFWYQRQALAGAGWIPGPFNAAPQYALDYPPTTYYNFPSVPQTPWAWETPQLVHHIETTPPWTLTLRLIPLGINLYFSGYAYLGIFNPNYPAAPKPHHVVSAGWTYITPNPTLYPAINMIVQGFFPPQRSGSRFAVGTRHWVESTQRPSLTTWTSGAFS